MEESSKLRSLPSYQRWLFIAVVFLAGCYLAVQLVISLFLEPYAEQKLKSAFHKTTQKAYILDFDDLDLNLIGPEISVENISIYPDSSRLDSVRLSRKSQALSRFQSDNFSIRKIGIFDMFLKDRLNIGSVELKNPQIFLEHDRNQKKADSTSTGVNQNLNARIYNSISTYFKSLAIDEIEITGASLAIKEAKTGKDILMFRNGFLQLSDIIADSTSAKREQFFITDKLEWSAQEVSWTLPDNLYSLKAHALGGSSSDQNVFADSLRLEPLYPKYEFSQTVGNEIDRIDLMIKRLVMDEVNFDSLMHNRKLIAGTLKIKNAEMDIFHDKRLPGGITKVKPLPHLKFREIDFPVKIDTISIVDSYISYSEHLNKVANPGTVTFEELEAMLLAVSNRKPDSKESDAITFEAKTKVMGSGLLNVYFSFPTSDTSGRHSIYGSLGSMSMKDLNPVLENVGLVHVEDGLINSLEFSMVLDKRKAKGSLTLNYKDLNIKILETDEVKEGGTKKLTSFIANTFVIEKSNTEEPLRKGNIEFERIEEKSVFNYWWKSLLSGIKDNIGQ